MESGCRCRRQRVEEGREEGEEGEGHSVLGCALTPLPRVHLPSTQVSVDSPSRLRRISSGETGRSFLSALISSKILSWRLRGRGGVGFSFLAETLTGDSGWDVSIYSEQTTLGVTGCRSLAADLKVFDRTV